MRRDRSATGARRATAGARLRVWIAVLALLSYSALPLAHHARSADGETPAPLEAGAVCTSDNLRAIERAPDGGRSDDPSQGSYSCPICQTLQHALMALPPTPWTLAAPARPAAGEPPATAAPSHRVVVAQPRAPPAIA